MPTVPLQPARSQVCLGMTRVGVDSSGSTSAGAIRFTTTTPACTSPIMQPMNSVENERYCSSKKRRACSDRTSARGAFAALTSCAAADRARRAGSGCKASSDTIPKVAPRGRNTRSSVPIEPAIIALTSFPPPACETAPRSFTHHFSQVECHGRTTRCSHGQVVARRHVWRRLLRQVTPITGGNRTLAYAIKTKDTGYDVVSQFEAAAELLPEYERVVKLDEAVLRFLVVVSEGLPAKPEAAPAVIAAEVDEIEEEEA